MTQVSKLADHRFSQADYAFHRYAANVPVGTTIEDVLHPEFFGNCLSRMRPGMEISVLSEDFKLDARLRVLSTSKTTAKLRVLSIYPGDDTEPDLSQVKVEGIRVGWGGPNHKWRVLHDRTVVEHGFATEGEAQEAADAYAAKANG
jgi:hypothetical protein